MEIAQASSNTPTQSLLNTVNGTQSANKGTVNDIQDRFMTLLVTQMKNQDPLNPMDNAQVTSQMAQLSTVTGIDKLNVTMESLISSVQASQSYQASSMIGHNVLVPGNQVSTDGTGGFFGVDLPLGAEALQINIKDNAGATIRTLNLGSQSSGTIPFSWDGYTNDGTVAVNGNYKVEVSAKTAGQNVEASTLSYAQVLSVSNASNGVKLNLSNADSVNTSDVREIF